MHTPQNYRDAYEARRRGNSKELAHALLLFFIIFIACMFASCGQKKNPDGKAADVKPMAFPHNNHILEVDLCEANPPSAYYCLSKKTKPGKQIFTNKDVYLVDAEKHTVKKISMLVGEGFGDDTLIFHLSGEKIARICKELGQ